VRDPQWVLRRASLLARRLCGAVFDVELARYQHDAGTHECKACRHEISIIVHPCHTPLIDQRTSEFAPRFRNLP
jgi:hypothetical protein